MKDARILDQFVSCPLVEEAGSTVLHLSGDPRYRRSAASERIMDRVKKGRANTLTLETRVDRDESNDTATAVDGAGDKTYEARIRLSRYQNDVGDLSRRTTHAP